MAKNIEKGIGSVPNLLREMQKADKMRASEKAYKDELKKRSESNPETARPKKIGRRVFAEGEKVVPKKASSSLRTAQIGSGTVVKRNAKKKLQPACGSGVGSALMDRVHSLQRRNMVELPPTASADAVFRAKKRGKRQGRAMGFKQTRLKIED